MVFFALFAASATFYLFIISTERNYFDITQEVKSSRSPTPKKIKQPELYQEAPPISTKGIAFGMMVIVGVGTLSTILLTWRNDKRNRNETELRIKKLELEIANLKSNRT